jgi:hypothetical protein
VLKLIRAFLNDCNIYVRSHHAGERVRASISRFLTDKLHLKVNEAKARWRDPRNVNFLDSALRMTGASDALRIKSLYGAHANSSSRALASFKSGVSKPSVKQL